MALQNLTLKNKKVVFLSIIIVVVVAVIAYSIFRYYLYTPTPASNDSAQIGSKASNDVAYSPPTNEQKKDGEQTKLNKIDTTDNTQVDYTASISSITTSGSDVIVSTSLEGLSWQTCTLTMTNGNASFTKTASVLYQESFSTCTGFTIPRSSFSTKGTWTFTLFVEGLSGNNTSTTKTYSID